MPIAELRLYTYFYAFSIYIVYPFDASKLCVDVVLKEMAVISSRFSSFRLCGVSSTQQPNVYVHPIQWKYGYFDKAIMHEMDESLFFAFIFFLPISWVCNQSHRTWIF